MIPTDVNFNETPLLVIWEATRACALACKHCRASAIDIRHPDELTTDEAKKMLDDIAQMGTPIIVFTGGDPIQRNDLEELIRHAAALGLRPGAIPASTDRLTNERILSLKKAGLAQLALSLDGKNAQQHDGFRRVPGSFDIVLKAAQWAKKAKLPLQINTVFGQWNMDDFHEIAALVETLGTVFWEVFFLVPTGRGAQLTNGTALEYERLFEKMYALAPNVPFVIKVTEGQHYRRFMTQQKRREAKGLRQTTTPKPRPRHGLTITRQGVNAGKGFCFVDHIGDVYPSGFLPKVTTNIRKKTIYDIYRNHETFKALRDTNKLQGRCGRCEFKDSCGGSRARAYALTNNLFAEDPCCIYVPPKKPTLP